MIRQPSTESNRENCRHRSLEQPDGDHRRIARMARRSRVVCQRATQRIASAVASNSSTGSRRTFHGCAPCPRASARTGSWTSAAGRRASATRNACADRRRRYTATRPIKSGATSTTFRFSSRDGIRIEQRSCGMLSGGSQVRNTDAEAGEARDCRHAQQEQGRPRQVARRTRSARRSSRPPPSRLNITPVSAKPTRARRWRIPKRTNVETDTLDGGRVHCRHVVDEGELDRGAQQRHDTAGGEILHGRPELLAHGRYRSTRGRRRQSIPPRSRSTDESPDRRRAGTRRSDRQPAPIRPSASTKIDRPIAP